MIVEDVKEPVPSPSQANAGVIPAPGLTNSPILSAENQEDQSLEGVVPPPPYQVNDFDPAGSGPSSTRLSVDCAFHGFSVSLKPKDRRGRPFNHKRIPFAIGLFILALIVAAPIVVPPVYFKLIKPRNEATRTQTRGGNGSRVIMEDGTEFVYLNPFGGFWVDNPENPYDDSSQPNSWTPPLNESWNFESHRIHGVNLGGLFVLENLTTPVLFQTYQAIDEWTLSTAMAKDTANGGLNQLEEHYRKFITEQDIAEIAGAGLTWVRIPIGFWAIETFPGEPFPARTSWKYILRVLQWCRKYGLRVNLSLYTVPGSANGDLSGKWSTSEFLRGVMGLSNAQRTLYYIRVLAEFVSRPEWTNVVPMLSILNSPADQAIGRETIRSFFVEAHRVVREVTDYGPGKGPYLVLYDGYDQPSGIFDDGFLVGADRVILERQVTFEWHDARNLSLDPFTVSSVGNICRWGPLLNQSRALHGMTIASEFSASFLMCGDGPRGLSNGQYLGECKIWTQSDDWGGAGVKASLQRLVAAKMDALGDYFFYTWKVGTPESGKTDYPLWSYQLGHRNGWIPKDPRQAQGACQSVLSASSFTVTVAQTWDGSYRSARMTGGPGASTPTGASRYPWPPSSIAGTGYGPTPLSLPTYTSTGAAIVLPGPTFTDSKGRRVSLRPSRTAFDPGPAPTPVAGCNYPDAWDAVEIDFTQVCTDQALLSPTGSIGALANQV